MNIADLMMANIQPYGLALRDEVSGGMIFRFTKGQIVADVHATLDEMASFKGTPSEWENYICEQAMLFISEKEKALSGDVGNIIFLSKTEAKQIKKDLISRLERDGIVTVRYFYKLCGYTCPPSDNSFWTNLDGLRVLPHPKGVGYILTLPPTQEST